MKETLRACTRVPVTVIYGLPGCGKTTVAGYLSGRCPDRRIVVSRIDGYEEMSGRVGDLGKKERVDYLLLESGTSCEPEALAAHLTAGGRTGAALAEIVRLDTMVAVVDASSLFVDFCSWGVLDDGRALVEALAEQIEFADVVVLSKVDRATETVRRNAGVLVRALNPEAVIVESEFGCVPPHKVLSTHAFDFARARARASWVQVLSGATGSLPREFGISSFLYESWRPFHPQRLMHFVRSEWPGVVRCRGFFWLSTRMDTMGELTQAGASRRHRAAGSWWAVMPAARNADKAFMESLSGVRWHPRFGDRRQQLAFIGIDMNESFLRSRLDACLLDDRELACGPDAWRAHHDPFPPWNAVDTEHPHDPVH